MPTSNNFQDVKVYEHYQILWQLFLKGWSFPDKPGSRISVDFCLAAGPQKLSFHNNCSSRPHPSDNCWHGMGTQLPVNNCMTLVYEHLYYFIIIYLWTVYGYMYTQLGPKDSKGLCDVNCDFHLAAVTMCQGAQFHMDYLGTWVLAQPMTWLYTLHLFMHCIYIYIHIYQYI